MTHLLGLTGSIGMGKSTTANTFREEGVPVWDADQVVHQLYSPGGTAVAKIGHVFPSAIVDAGVSREKLKDIIRQDSSALDKIEHILKPLLNEHRQDFINNHDDPLLLFDIPLLFETGADKWLDSVLVVTAPQSVQRSRVLARDGMTEAHFDNLLSRQMPDAAKRTRADYVIETLDMDQTRAAVQKLIAEITGQPNA